MTNDEINRYVHVEIMGRCVHANAKRNPANTEPLNILNFDCPDCGRSLTQREYFDENWDCRHSEKEPKFGAVRVCKHCGADDVSFDLPIKPRPDYCSDSSPRSLLNEVVAKLEPTLSYEMDMAVLRMNVGKALRIRIPAEQIARACVEAHKATHVDDGREIQDAGCPAPIT